MCIRDSVDPHRDAAFELAGPHCTYASRIGAEQARCALRRERIVFLGDSTMRQLFAAVACKLDGSKRPRVRQPGNLPKRSDDGRWPLKWVVYKNMVGSNQCELEVVEPKGTEKRRKEVLQFTWDVPGGDDIRASFHWAEHADDIERIAAMGAAAVPKGDANATIVIANVGLYNIGEATGNDAIFMIQFFLYPATLIGGIAWGLTKGNKYFAWGVLVSLVGVPVALFAALFIFLIVAFGL